MKKFVSPLGALGLLPPWEAMDERDTQWMRSWVNCQLDMTLEHEMRDDALDEKHDAEKYFAWLENYGPEIEDAERYGDMAPMHAKMRAWQPGLVKFLQRLKKPGPGQSFEPRKPEDEERMYAELDPVAEARADVKRIYAIWRKHYNKKNRRGQLTANEIAADRWGVTADDVINRKKRGQ